ncbi:MAG: hypothetical protein LDLANPLL_00583 [Turneriella sp.]|nr:hypothetical protein [Turneriella sp.]
MKCKKQPLFLENKPIKIADVWEIRLSSTEWKKLCQMAKKRHSTISSITRYCVFQLAQYENLRWTSTLDAARNKVKKENMEECHRHMLCLYGDDVVLLQLAALRLKISVSLLVRVALFLYLPRLAVEIHSKRYITPTQFFYKGIKFWQNIFFRGLNHFRVPAIRQQLFQSFFPWQWWGAPLYE